VHIKSENSFETDAPVDNHGKGRTILSYRPYEYQSLAPACYTVMGIKAKTMRFDLNGVEIEVEKIMKADREGLAVLICFFISLKICKTLMKKQRPF
jgi:uncharacterized OsmC-like protein